MTSFEQQVAAALAQIPHSEDCSSHDAYPMLTQGAVPYPCDCDREQRVAADVATAIEAAMKSAYRATGSPSGVWPQMEDGARLSALAALRGKR